MRCVEKQGNIYHIYLSHLKFNFVLISRYGCAQMYKLPQAGFRFMSESEKANINWETEDMTLNIGYFVECDLDYPEEIWQYTRDFPLCPENIVITDEMLSPFQKESLEVIYGSTRYKEKKLTATFLPKNKM